MPLRPARSSLALLLLLPLVGACGCASLGGSRAGTPQRVRTITTIGDEPVTVVAGEPGGSIVADTSGPTRNGQPDRVVAGRVIDARGEPVPQATVRLAIDGTPAGRTVRVATDPAGRFTLRNLRQGAEYTLIAEWQDEAGHVQTGRARVLVPQSGVEIALETPGDPGSSATAARINRISGRQEPAPEEPLPEPVAEHSSAPETSRPGGINFEDVPLLSGERENGLAGEIPQATEITGSDQAPAPIHFADAPAPTPGATADAWRRGDATGPDLGSYAGMGQDDLGPAVAPNMSGSANQATRPPLAPIPVEEDIPNPLPLVGEPAAPASPSPSDSVGPDLLPLPGDSPPPTVAAAPEPTFLPPTASASPTAAAPEPAPPPFPELGAEPAAPAAAAPQSSASEALINAALAGPSESPVPPAAGSPVVAPGSGTNSTDASVPAPVFPSLDDAPAPADSFAPVQAQPPGPPVTGSGPANSELSTALVEPQSGPAAAPVIAEEPRAAAPPVSAPGQTAPPGNVVDQALSLPPSTEASSNALAPPLEVSAPAGKPASQPTAAAQNPPVPAEAGAGGASAMPELPPGDAVFAGRGGTEAAGGDAIAMPAGDIPLPEEAPLPDGSIPANSSINDIPLPEEPTPEASAHAGETIPARPRTWGELATSAKPAENGFDPQPPVDEPGLMTAAQATSSVGAPQGRDTELAPPADPSLVRASCDFDRKAQRLVDFQLPDLAGQPVQFRDLDADFILLDFWGTWCGPCVRAIPHLVALQDRYGSERLKVVGIAYEQGETVHERAVGVASVARRLGINYRVLLGEADSQPCPLQAALHVQFYPTMILLDREGRILWREHGATPTTLAKLERVIASQVQHQDAPRAVAAFPEPASGGSLLDRLRRR